MNDLLVIAFPSEQNAEEVRRKLFEMQKENLIDMSDAVVAVKDAEGHVRLNQLLTRRRSGVSPACSGARSSA